MTDNMSIILLRNAKTRTCIRTEDGTDYENTKTSIVYGDDGSFCYYVWMFINFWWAWTS